MEDALLTAFLSRLTTNGIAILIGACCFFTVSSSLLKHVTGTFSAGEIALARFGIGALILSPLLLYQKISLDKRDLFFLTLRGLSGALTFYAFVLALKFSSLSVTVMLLFTSPIWALLLGASFLKERLTLGRIAGIIVAFAGIWILINPSSTGIAIRHLYGLTAGMFSGINFVLTRYLRIRHNAQLINAIQCYVGTLVSIPLLAGNIQMPELTEGLLFLLLVAVSGLLAQLIMAYGLRFIYAAEGATLMMAEAVFTAIAGFLLFKEVLTLQFTFGAIMILGSGIYLGLRTGRKLAGSP
jgi:drug/metabolite transporter (DMT)-like permease